MTLQRQIASISILTKRVLLDCALFGLYFAWLALSLFGCVMIVPNMVGMLSFKLGSKCLARAKLLHFRRALGRTSGVKPSTSCGHSPSNKVKSRNSGASDSTSYTTASYKPFSDYDDPPTLRAEEWDDPPTLR